MYANGQREVRHLGNLNRESTFGQEGTPGMTSWRRVSVLSPEGGTMERWDEKPA